MGSEFRCDRIVIGEVLTIAPHGRRIDGRQPEEASFQIGEMIESQNDRGNSADLVAVAVAEAARMDRVAGAGSSPEGHGVRHLVLADGLRLGLGAKGWAAHLIDPASEPRTRTRCRVRSTASGATIDTKPEVASISQSPPRVPFSPTIWRVMTVVSPGCVDQEDHGRQRVVPGPQELKDSKAREGRDAERQHDAGEDLELRRPVDPRSRRSRAADRRPYRPAKLRHILFRSIRRCAAG